MIGKDIDKSIVPLFMTHPV